MPRFAANLSWLFLEHEFLDRFRAAADAGFHAVEFLFPYDHPAETVAERLAAAKLELVLFNLPPGDWTKGERGLAALPGREADFEAALERALRYARVLGCRTIHAMSGLAEPGRDTDATYRANLKRAAAAAKPHGITVVIEPINHRDIPGFYLNTVEQAADAIAAVGADNLHIQFDFYHCQITQGDLAMRFKQHFRQVGHIQVAGVPGRHEPTVGEINYPYLFDEIDSLGYTGHIGCEYKPADGTLAGLAWARPYGIVPKRTG
jgi:hydroxypyruvate isomerase